MNRGDGVPDQGLRLAELDALTTETSPGLSTSVELLTALGQNYR
jgi:hypothetical protein